MMIYYLFIKNYLRLEFCGLIEPCVKCPDNGICSGKELVCSQPFIPIRYDCAEYESLPYYTQSLLIDIEMHLCKKAFLYGIFEITETEILKTINPDNIVVSKLLELLQANQSKILSLVKNNKRRVVVDKSQGFWLGLLLYIDKFDWVVLLVPVLFVAIKFLVKTAAKIKIE